MHIRILLIYFLKKLFEKVYTGNYIPIAEYIKNIIDNAIFDLSFPALVER